MPVESAQTPQNLRGAHGIARCMISGWPHPCSPSAVGMLNLEQEFAERARQRVVACFQHGRNERSRYFRVRSRPAAQRCEIGAASAGSRRTAARDPVLSGAEIEKKIGLLIHHGTDGCFPAKEAESTSKGFQA